MRRWSLSDFALARPITVVMLLVATLLLGSIAMLELPLAFLPANAASQVINAGLSLTLSSTTSIENTIGGVLGDTLTGNTLANVLTGGPGNDTLTGGPGNDSYLFAANVNLGSDTINEAGGGVDTLDFSGTTTQSVSVNLSNAASQVVNPTLSLTLSAGNTIEKLNQLYPMD